MKEVDKWAITTVTQEEDRDGIKNCQQYHVQVGPVNVVFNPGWEIKTVGKKTRKGQVTGAKSGAQFDKPSSVRNLEVIGSQRQGTWVRMNRPNIVSNTGDPIVKEGPKRKSQVAVKNVNEWEIEKKVKIYEEAKKLSLLMTSEFQAAEVVEQPRRVQ